MYFSVSIAPKTMCQHTTKKLETDHWGYRGGMSGRRMRRRGGGAMGGWVILLPAYVFKQGPNRNPKRAISTQAKTFKSMENPYNVHVGEAMAM